MKVELLVPDSGFQGPVQRADSGAFVKALDGVAAMLDGAQRSEDAYAAGTGSLQAAVYERARADVALSVATAAASRATQALQTILNMQV